MEDVRLKEDSYGSLLRMSLGLARIREPAHTRRRRRRCRDAECGSHARPHSRAVGDRPRARDAELHRGRARACAQPARVAKIRTSWPHARSSEKARLTHLLEQVPDVRVHYLEDLKARVGLTDKLWVLWHALFPGLLGKQQKPDDAAIVLFTSGSEGKPKGVVHSHTSILSNVAQMRAVADFSPLDKFIDRAPAVPFVRAHLRRGHAAGVGLPRVPVSEPAALSDHP